ncbi:MAG: homoserine O-acetyltransferase [Thiotrichales bacterium]|nr:homoserine O-acetyltransferase [Thiotrichales bacterium]
MSIAHEKFDGKVVFLPGSATSAVKTIHIPSPLTLQRGGVLQDVVLAYETWGELNEARDNAILLFTGLSPGTHAASNRENPKPGWWEFMIGEGKPIDSSRYHVICVNSLGSCFGSTGPITVNPATKRPYGFDFPEITIEDIVYAAHLAMSEMSIKCLHTVMGSSLGGMAAFHYALEYPDQVGNLVSISASAASSPFAIGVRSLQREIVTCDPEWKDGHYEVGKGPFEGMRIARKLGLTSYRSADEWLERFGREKVAERADDADLVDIEFQVESYLEHNARKFAEKFDANSYLYLSRVMDWFDGRQHPLLLSKEAPLPFRSLVIGISSDVLFTVDEQRDIATRLEEAGGDVVFTDLGSPYGHDSFLVDEDAFMPAIREFLDASLDANSAS